MTLFRHPFATLRGGHRHRLGQSGAQSGFAMMIALLLILVIAGMSLLVAGLVISENKPTQTARKTVATVNAAEAGFEAALSQMRAATDTYGNGDVSQLPCTTSTAPGTPITGSVGPKSGAAKNATLTYSVYVRYYLTDPSAMGSADLALYALSCSGGQPTDVPQYAYLTANGAGTVGANTSAQNNRLLHTTYRFQTSNLNIAGGRLNMNGTSFCLDSGTAPAANSLVNISTCTNRGVTPGQSSWAYRADLTLYLTTSGTPGLCITAGTTFGTASTARLTLQTCATDGTGGTTYPYQASPSLQQRQEWNFDDSGRFEGASSTGDVNGNCISASSPGSPAAGGVVYEQACTGDGPSILNPDFQVGAGPAGDATGQLVNYYEFGRCMDVTHASVSEGMNPAIGLIDYPCKQAPDPTNIRWNERWIYNATAHTLMSPSDSGGSYCLDGPSAQSAVPASNPVTIQTCNSADPTQKWTEKGAVVGDYGSSYTIVSNFGACLSITTSRLTGYDAQWSALITETCDGSLKQKWNAPANFVDSRFKGTGEDQGGQS
jgi:hypothetical protein